MENVWPKDKGMSATKFADLILEVSTILLESGAHCERINRNVQRIAETTCYKVEMLLTFTAVSVTVTDRENPENTVTGNRRVRHHGAHFGVLTNTSLLTWDLFENKISLDELENCLNEIKAASKHPVWLIRVFIGVACGCLCLLAGGDWVDGAFAFVASLIGLTVRQEMVKKGFNLMVAVVSSAFMTTTISGMNVLFGCGLSPDISVATAVLFLIPGVPLINCIIDLLEGFIPTGIARGAFGGFILLCIAIGMFMSMSLIGINNF
ncbi:threonine/serine ThrE exporter family protein [Dysgonomonas gadei]|uniref:threonine/serine ThrE exporter family protein n=1 Tax=Dysgonomonas gadei TaxID=156974 RepID=UPI003AF0253C